MIKDYEVLISEVELKSRIKTLADEIRKEFKGETVHLVCILKGAIMFYSDLIKELTDMDIIVDFFGTSSYGNGKESTGVKITKDLDENIFGKNVILVEDIVDTGHTLDYISRVLKERNPKRFEICTLLDKYERRVVDVDVKYVGFKIEDKFVVGYGFDDQQRYRHLPYIGVVE